MSKLLESSSVGCAGFSLPIINRVGHDQMGFDGIRRGTQSRLRQSRDILLDAWQRQVTLKDRPDVGIRLDILLSLIRGLLLLHTSSSMLAGCCRPRLNHSRHAESQRHPEALRRLLTRSG